MKILFVFHLPWMSGGASKSGVTLVKGLAGMGHNVVALCPAEGEVADVLRDCGVEVKILCYEWAYPHFERNFVGLIKFIPKLIRDRYINRRALNKLSVWCEDFTPDIVHSNSSVLDIGVKLAKKIGAVHVTHYREFGWKDTSSILWHEKSMKRYKRQYGIAIGKEIYKYHTALSDRNILVYNGIVDSNKVRINEKKENWFLYVGSIVEEKGIRDMLYAYSAVERKIRDLHPLKIAGAAYVRSYLDQLKNLCMTLGIDENVEWLGERNDVMDLMFNAKALIVPSRNEAFGRIVAEAMANGCLVIGRNRAGIREQFDNGLDNTGEEIGLRYESIEELTRYITRVALDDDANYIHMELKALSVVVSLYSVDSYVNNIEKFYEKIL